MSDDDSGKSTYRVQYVVVNDCHMDVEAESEQEAIDDVEERVMNGFGGDGSLMESKNFSAREL